MASRSTQSGNIFFYIFLGIVLFAALGYAVSQNTLNPKSLSKEKTNLMANEIIDYSNKVADAISTLRLRGCKTTEISFENSTVTGYTNASAPSDKRCHVFDPAGGGINWRNFTELLATNTSFAASDGTQQVGWVGTGNLTDIFMRVPFNTTKGDAYGICDVINARLGLDADNKTTTTWEPSVDGYWAGTKFTGTFNDGGTIMTASSAPGWANPSGLKNSIMFCGGHNTGAVSFFRAVLIR